MAPSPQKTGNPFFQAKLSINQPGDVYEQEADAMADKVMRSSGNEQAQPFFKPSPIPVQLKCAHCEEEEKKLHRKETESDSEMDASTEKYITSLSGGSSLGKDEQQFFGSRMGYDFSNVKIHTGAAATESAQSINALAYTTGNNIVFNNNQYAPGNDSGKRLLAHELTHVVQQRNAVQPTTIQRMTMGVGAPPAHWVTDYNARPIPAEETDRVNAAFALIQDIVDHPENYQDCISSFISHCSTKSPTAFADTFRNAIIWRGDNPGVYARGQTNGNHIFYTQLAYDDGVTGLARTLVHEMGHNCGVTGADDHYLAEVSSVYCIGYNNSMGMRVGIGVNTSAYSLAVTYRRFFDLALGGQLQLSLGADFDLIGLGAGIADASQGLTSGPEFEFGSVSAGLQGRFNPWGGERFGGLTLSGEAGFDAGRFRITRETAPDEYEYGAGFVVQSTLGAEFYIPHNPFITELSLDAGYRMIRPLNTEAENIHEVVFGVRGFF